MQECIVYNFSWIDLTTLKILWITDNIYITSTWRLMGFFRPSLAIAKLMHEWSLNIQIRADIYIDLIEVIIPDKEDWLCYYSFVNMCMRLLKETQQKSDDFNKIIHEHTHRISLISIML